MSSRPATKVPACVLVERLKSAECEEIAERFVNAMYAQASGACGGTVTAALLTELWETVLEWHDAAVIEARKGEIEPTYNAPREIPLGNEVLTLTELARRAGVSGETMRRRLMRMSPEQALALGNPHGRPTVKPSHLELGRVA